jgi:hypothetical protein
MYIIQIHPILSIVEPMSFIVIVTSLLGLWGHLDSWRKPEHQIFNAYGACCIHFPKLLQPSFLKEPRMKMDETIITLMQVKNATLKK